MCAFRELQNSEEDVTCALKLELQAVVRHVIRDQAQVPCRKSCSKPLSHLCSHPHPYPRPITSLLEEHFQIME